MFKFSIEHHSSNPLNDEMEKKFFFRLNLFFHQNTWIIVMEKIMQSACKLTMLLAVAIHSYNEFPTKYLSESDQHTFTHRMPTKTSFIFYFKYFIPAESHSRLALMWLMPSALWCFNPWEVFLWWIKGKTRIGSKQNVL